jgi:RNA polymerase sigma factor (sigma-70 family)
MNMSTEPAQWIQAEEGFHKWIENPELYPENQDTNLRKSIHIYFRRKYHDLLTPVTKWFFENLQLDDLLNKEKGIPQAGIVYEPKEKYYGIRFKIVTDYYTFNKRILEGFRKDDKEIIYEFYENEFSKVAFLILNNGGTIEDVKDIFQDALVILMDKYTWDKLDLLGCSLGTYIYSISRNLWYEQLRKKKKENDFVDIRKYETINISIEYYETEPDAFELVNKVIESLGDPCKQLLKLYYFENYS